MAEVILITSGKGGVGKSVVCGCLGAALASLEKQVLLLEASRRSLDVLFGVPEQVVFDLSDAAGGRCSLDDALLQLGETGRLQLICAPVGGAEPLGPALCGELIDALDAHFDFVLVDIDGTRPQELSAYAEPADRAVIVSTPDQVSVRDGRVVSDLLYRCGLEDIRLCVNQLTADFVRQRPVPDLDWMIDQVCAQLIAVVPYDKTLAQIAITPTFLSNTSKNVFYNFAQRILGNYIDLLIQ